MTKLLARVLAFIIIVGLLYLLLDSPLVGRVLYPLHYQDVIEENAHRFDLEPALVAAVIRVESSFQPDAVSRRGARGLMQLMPKTANWIIEEMKLDLPAGQVEELLFAPDFNIMLGCWYLNNLSREFNDDAPLVLAAYNAGRGTVNQWLQDGVWDGTMANREQIPFPETRSYLGKIELARTRYARYYFQEADLSGVRIRP